MQIFYNAAGLDPPSVRARTCVCDSLVEQGHRGASLALLDHVGLISKRDAESGWSQSAWLAVHLNRKTR